MGTIETISKEPDRLSVSPSSHPPRWDDAALVERVLRGELLAENLLFRRYAPLLLNMAAHLLRRTGDADDVVQETFVIAFRKLSALNEPRALRSWLVRILLSQVGRALRVRRFKAFFGMDTSEENADLLSLAVHDATPEVQAMLSEIDASLQRAPVSWRTAWVLHRVEGMSISETADAMARSTASVKRYVKAVDMAIRLQWGEECTG